MQKSRNSLWHFFISFSQALLALFLIQNQSLHGSENTIKSDLSAGTALPSMNSSVWENPAALGLIGGRRGDIAVYTSSGSFQGGGGNLVGKIASAGLGFQVARTNNSNDVVDLGIGLPVVGSFNLGFGYSRSITTSFTQYMVGSRFGISSKIAGSLVFEDITNLPGIWTFGLAGQLGPQLNLAVDFNFYGFQGTLEPSSVISDLALVYTVEKQISFKFGVTVPTYPTFQFSLSNPIVGLSYWPSQKIGVYFLMNDTPSQYVIGVKFL
jgi:hypothetical protein